MISAYIPSPSISSFSLGPITIRFYAIMILIGIVAATWITTIRWKKVGGTFDQVLDIAIVAVPCGIIGARLYHIITTPSLYFGPGRNWTDMFKIWNGGLGIWGAVLLGGLGAWAWCRHRRYPMALLADCLAPALLVAQAIGRLGNWFNQELYGSCTTLPWGLKLNSSSAAVAMSGSYYNAGSCGVDGPFHPTFLYELIWNLIGAVLLIVLTQQVRKRFKAGSLFALYIMWYTLGRVWIENLRIDYAVKVLGLRINVWVSICVFVAAAVAFVLLQRYSVFTKILSDRLRAVTALEAKVDAGSMTAQQLKDTYKKERKNEQAQAQASRDLKKKKRREHRREYEEAKARVLARKKMEEEDKSHNSSPTTSTDSASRSSSSSSLPSSSPSSSSDSSDSSEE